jgi:hypothetical protein
MPLALVIICSLAIICMVARASRTVALCALGLCALAFVTGPLHAPIAEVKQEIHAWQERQAAKLDCAAQEARAAQAPSAPEPQASCQSAPVAP